MCVLCTRCVGAMLWSKLLITDMSSIISSSITAAAVHGGLPVAPESSATAITHGADVIIVQNSDSNSLYRPLRALPMQMQEIAQRIGQVFLQRSAVNLLSSVLDTPEFFWSAPDQLQVSIAVYCALRLCLSAAPSVSDVL